MRIDFDRLKTMVFKGLVSGFVNLDEMVPDRLMDCYKGGIIRVHCVFLGKKLALFV